MNCIRPATLHQLLKHLFRAMVYKLSSIGRLASISRESVTRINWAILIRRHWMLRMLVDLSSGFTNSELNTNTHNSYSSMYLFSFTLIYFNGLGNNILSVDAITISYETISAEIFPLANLFFEDWYLMINRFQHFNKAWILF